MSLRFKKFCLSGLSVLGVTLGLMETALAQTGELECEREVEFKISGPDLPYGVTPRDFAEGKDWIYVYGENGSFIDAIAMRQIDFKPERILSGKDAALEIKNGVTVQPEGMNAYLQFEVSRASPDDEMFYLSNMRLGITGFVYDNLPPLGSEKRVRVRFRHMKMNEETGLVEMADKLRLTGTLSPRGPAGEAQLYMDLLDIVSEDVFNPTVEDLQTVMKVIASLTDRALGLNFYIEDLDRVAADAGDTDEDDMFRVFTNVSYSQIYNELKDQLAADIASFERGVCP